MHLDACQDSFAFFFFSGKDSIPGRQPEQTCWSAILAAGLGHSRSCAPRRNGTPDSGVLSIVMRVFLGVKTLFSRLKVKLCRAPHGRTKVTRELLEASIAATALIAQAPARMETQNQRPHSRHCVSFSYRVRCRWAPTLGHCPAGGSLPACLCGKGLAEIRLNSRNGGSPKNVGRKEGVSPAMPCRRHS